VAFLTQRSLPLEDPLSEPAQFIPEPDIATVWKNRSPFPRKPEAGGGPALREREHKSGKSPRASASSSWTNVPFEELDNVGRHRLRGFRMQEQRPPPPATALLPASPHRCPHGLCFRTGFLHCFGGSLSETNSHENLQDHYGPGPCARGCPSRPQRFRRPRAFRKARLARGSRRYFLFSPHIVGRRESRRSAPSWGPSLRRGVLPAINRFSIF